MSASAESGFRRAILGLDCQSATTASLEIAAGLAAAMKLDLHGIFVLDEMLEAVAGYPGAREFRPGPRQWRAVDSGRLRSEQLELALGLQRRITARAGAQNLACSFEIVTGRLADVLSSRSSRSDILVVAEPRENLASLTHSFTRIVEAAIRSAASVLLIPQQAVSSRSGVIVLAASSEDPAIVTGRQIAAATGEILSVVDSSAANMAEALASLPPPRLVVCSRTGSLTSPDHIVETFPVWRETPLLILEPSLNGKRLPPKAKRDKQ